MNKKGTDKILSIYWFIVLTIVAGGIFAMVYVFYGAPYDVRGVESELLTQKIADCISKQGLIEENLFSEEGFNEEIKAGFTEMCGITFNVEDSYVKGEPQYFYKVEFYDIKNVVNPVFSVSDGNLNWENECYLKKANSKDYAKLAKCNERRLYAVDSKNDQYLIKILSAVGKSEKNVKA